MKLIVTDNYNPVYSDDQIVLLIHKSLYFDDDLINSFGIMVEDFRWDLIGVELIYEKT